MRKVVIDTNVFISALLGRTNSYSRRVIGLALEGKIQPLVGVALFNEYWDVLSRPKLFEQFPLNQAEREEFLAAFISCCAWTRIYFNWRPNLRDESDNHVVELAIAGGAQIIITQNIRDLVSGELSFPDLEIVTPEVFIKDSKWAQ